MPSVVKVPTAVICVAESLVTESAGVIAPNEDIKSTCTPSLKLVPTIVKVVCEFVAILGEIEVKVGKFKTRGKVEIRFFYPKQQVSSVARFGTETFETLHFSKTPW